MLRCTHCGGETRVVASEHSYAGYVIRRELRCVHEHQTFSVELPNSVFSRAGLKNYSAQIERLLHNDLRQEQRRRRRARVIELIKEGWKPLAISNETGMSEGAVKAIKKKINAETGNVAVPPL